MLSQREEALVDAKLYKEQHVDIRQAHMYYIGIYDGVLMPGLG